MMENINIRINKKTRQVNLSKSVIGNDGENLQENLVFSFDEFVNGTARLEILKQGETASYIMLTKVGETYELPVKSVITKGGRLNMQLVITEGTDDEEIPIFKSNVFYMVVNSSINAEIEEPDEYPQWIDVANTKLNEIDKAIQEASNLNIDVNKENDVATITLTDKEGQTKEVQILDGEHGQDATINGVNTLNIAAGDNITLEQEDDTLIINSTGGGTSDYDNLSNKPSINNVELSGNKSLSDLGIQPEGNYYIKPTTGIPKTDLASDVQTSLGKADTALQEHQSLADYVRKTDYASGNNAGVIKENANGFLVGNTGLPRANEYTYSNYQSASNNVFISKGTLENVITGKGLISNTDYATSSTGGVFKPSSTYAIGLNSDGQLFAGTKTYSDYTSTNNNVFISKGTLENVITGKGLVSNTNYATNQVGGVILTNAYFGTDITDGNLKSASKTYVDYQNAPASCFISKNTLENVISGKGLQIQYATMPTASADILGKIVQYIGATDNNYTNGYFYKCVSDEQSTPTYSWVAIKVEQLNHETWTFTLSDNSTVTKEIVLW